MSRKPRKSKAKRSPAKPSPKRTAATRRRKANPLDAQIDAGLAALGLAFEPSWRAAIRTNLDVSLRHARAVAEFPLPDDTEPAPVFKA